MVRVVRPGGQVVAFEPNSLVQSLVLDTVSSRYTLDERLMQVRCQAIYERGKRQLGLGDDSVGDRLPQLFLDAGLKDVEVRLSDKAAALVPPYDTEEKQARVRELSTWLESYEANLDHFRACFKAGGGTDEDFAAFDAMERRENEAVRQLLAEEKFVHPGGMLTYIVIGTKG
jgi:hypothetical protein